MEKTELLKEIIEALKAEESATGDFSGGRSEPCDTYPADIYDLYVDSFLSEEEAQAFEAHLKGCHACCLGLDAALQREKAMAEDPLFSEDALSQSLTIKLQHMNDLFDSREASEREYLLAASGDTVRTGMAQGVAVNYETGRGALLECEAMIMPRKGTTGMIELRGLAVESITSNQREYEFTSPLKLLEDQLEDFFETVPVLKRFRLWDWDIAVDITSPEDREGYIFEARSLTLPILMTILYAATGKKGEPGRVFTGAISHKGRIKRIGHVGDKIRVASEQTASELIMPQDNRHECIGLEQTAPDLQIRCFSTLDILLQELDLITPSEKDMASFSKAEKEGSAPRVSPKPVTRTDQVDYRFLVQAALHMGIKEQAAVELAEFSEDFCQKTIEGRHIGTTLIIGRSDRINDILPEYPLQLHTKAFIASMRQTVCHLSRLVNGVKAAFIVDPDGFVAGVKRIVDPPWTGDSNTTLLTGMSQKHALMSKLLDALIIHMPESGNRVQVFSDGKKIGRYSYGEWVAIDLDAFGAFLKQTSARASIEQAVLRRLGRVALEMADRAEPAMFVIYHHSRPLEQNHFSDLKRFSAGFTGADINSITDSDLIHYARQNGMVLMDAVGKIVAIMAHPVMDITGLNSEPTMMTRKSLQALKLCRTYDCLCLLVTENGTIMFFDKNGKIHEI